MKLFRKYSLTKRFYLLFTITIAVSLSASLVFYFISFRSIMNEKSKNMENISANLIQNADNIASSVILMSESISTTPYTHAILAETKAVSKISSQQFLNRLINRLIKSTPYINNILLLDNAENIYSFRGFDYALASRLDQQYHILSQNAYPDGFTGALYLSDTDTTYYAYIQTIYDGDSTVSQKRLGTCVIICYSDSLEALCGNAASSTQALFALLDSENQILACNRKEHISFQELSGLDEHDHLILQSEASTLTGWKLFCSIPYQELYSELALIRHLTVLLILIPFLAFLLLARQISTTIVSPLAKIVNFFQKGSYYILHHRLETNGSQEIAMLTDNINQMLTEINDLTHTVLQNQAHLYEIQLSKNQAQLLALQTQINPHFLYNTLSTIQGMAYQGKCAEITTAVTALSYMMHYNVKEDNMASVKSEFHCIEKYLQIINLRFPGCFQFHFHMDDAIGDCPMPRFLLQPLAENAISHGLEPRQPEKGTLSLTASLQADSILHITCVDNGVGIPPEKLERLRREIEDASASDPQSKRQSGIGLLNVHTRIRLIYGTPFGLTISSSPEGTTVCVDFPADAPCQTAAGIRL